MAEAKVLLEQAEIAVDGGHNKQARELLRQLLAIEPRNSYAWELFSYAAQGREAAMDCLRRAMLYDPSNYSAWLELVKKVGMEKAKAFLPPGAPIPVEPAQAAEPVPVEPARSAPVLSEGVKLCPFCAEEVQAAAIVCKHCGRNLAGGAHNAESAVNTVSALIIVLLVVLGLFWIGVGLLQINVGLATAGQSGATFIGSGLFNLFISLINLLEIRGVLRRSKSVVRSLMFLAVAGSVWGFVQLVTGAWLQGFAVPIYIVLGVLALINKEHFSEGA